MIRALVKAGKSQSDVARRYGISRQRVGQIVHAPAPPPPRPRDWTPLINAIRDLRAVQPLTVHRQSSTARDWRADRALLGKCVTQLKMQSAMLGLRAVLSGVSPSRVEQLGGGAPVVDPFARLVPYARAMVALTTVVAKYVR